MRILIAASEVGPFARTGGLGDVVGALPQAMTKLGHEVIVAMPWYGTIDPVLTKKAGLSLSVSIGINGNRSEGAIYTLRDRKSKVTYWLVKADQYFDRAELYRDPSTGVDYIDNDERFLFFARAVLEMAEKSEFDPQVIHCHDWQAGLIPVLLRYAPDRHPSLKSARTLLTIHNLGYPGLFPPATFNKLELSPELFHAVTGPLEFYEQVNFLKGAIIASDKINTVSKTYSEEIQTKEYGAGLDGVLKTRREDLSGIVNGVDYAIWSPTRDKKIPFRFSRASLGGKRNCKVELMNYAGLPIRDRTPLIGIISRLADQKGFDLIKKGVAELLSMDLQIILLGTGELKYHDLFETLEKEYPDKLKAYLAFDDSLAHQIEAGSDMFLMPSQYEPCGLNQLYSLKYGTVPIVRKTGGLADTVIDYDPIKLTGTGFVFEEYTVKAMLEAIERAVELFKKNRTWKKLVKEGMKQDFSWSASAKKYSELYQSMVT